MTELESLLLTALERLVKETTEREEGLADSLSALAAQLAAGETQLQNLAAQLATLGSQVNYLTEQLKKLQATSSGSR